MIDSLVWEGLTVKQEEKWMKFLEAYPDFIKTNTIITTTSLLGKIFGCRSNNVLTHLTYISRGLGNKLHFQRMIRDSRNRLFKAGHADLRTMKGGRQQGCYKEDGLKGNSIFLHIYIDK